MARCKFFFSGVGGLSEKAKDYGVTGFNELLSYYEVKSKKMTFDRINELQKDRKELFIDSGAFSFFSKKQSPDLQEFIRWHKELSIACPQIKMKAGMDDIGNHEQTVKNQILTDEAGLDLFPTYHRLDPPETLKWIMDRNYKLMAFGGLAGGGLSESAQITDWIEAAFDAICIDGKPIIDVHLFGVSNVEIIHRFPAYSNDSASALFTAAYGATWIPNLHPVTHQPQWNKPMVRLPISKESPAAGNNNQHFLTLRKGQQDVIIEFMKLEGFDFQKIIDDSAVRGIFAIKMMLRQSENYPENVIFKRRAREHSLFEA